MTGTIGADGQQGGATGVAAGGGGSGGAIVLRAPEVSGGGASSQRRRRGCLGRGWRGRRRGRRAHPVGSKQRERRPDVSFGIGGAGAAGNGSSGGSGDVTTTGYKLNIVQSLPGLVRLSTEWHLNPALADGESTTPEFNYGTRPLVPFMGDWDGDGVRTPGYFQAGTFHLRNTNTGGAGDDITFAFGDRRGFVVVGDWNGDGLDDVAVYRNGTWQTRLTGCETTGSFSFGSGT